jgi:hypothetical protein
LTAARAAIKNRCTAAGQPLRPRPLLAEISLAGIFRTPPANKSRICDSCSAAFFLLAAMERY